MQGYLSKVKLDIPLFCFRLVLRIRLLELINSGHFTGHQDLSDPDVRISLILQSVLTEL